MIKNSQKLLKFWGKDEKKAKNSQNRLNSFNITGNTELFDFFDQFGRIERLELSFNVNSVVEFRISLISEEFIEDFDILTSQAKEHNFLIQSWEVQIDRSISPIFNSRMEVGLQVGPVTNIYNIRGIIMPPSSTPI